MAAAGAAAAALLPRRRVRRSLTEPPVPVPTFGPPPGDDFLNAEPDRVLAHRLHGGETDPVILVAERALRFLAGQGIYVFVIWAERGRDEITLLLQARREDQMHILELATSFGTRLGGRGRGVVTPDGDVALQVGGLKGGTVIAPMGHLPEAFPLLPLGVLPRGEVLSVNWQELGHILIAGLPGEGADVALSSLLPALTSHCHPDALRLWMIADHQTLPAQLRRLPHGCDAIDPHDSDRVHEVLQRLREELLRRMRAAEGKEEPWHPSREEREWVLVVGELTELTDDGTTLELIGDEGPRYGVRLLAATTRAGALDDMLVHFATRIILLTMDDAESIRLLGQPETADLGSGEFFARIARRTPVRVRGFRVAPEHLDALVRLMHDAYGRTSAGTCSARKVDEEAEEALALEPMMSTDERPVEDRELVRDEVDAALERPCDGLVPREDVALAGLTVHTAEVTDVAEAGEEDVPDHAEPGVVDMEMGAESGATEEEGPAGPPVEVRCFGGFIVESEGREVTSAWEEGASHKAWELLAFLSVQPAGIVLKERLLAAIWPDVEPERAVLRMRQAMHRLRSALGRQVPSISSEVVRADRDGICRLDTTLVTSDVHRFVMALGCASKLRGGEATGALEQARSLYRGDLLSGPTARGYEWLDERDDSGVTLREHYREQYFRATGKLARLYYEEGRAELAVPLYKEILRVEPTLEDIARQLYRCYGQLGDLTSLIREDRHLRQALREVDAAMGGGSSDAEEYQPEPETVALFAEIRQALEMRGVGKIDKG